MTASYRQPAHDGRRPGGDRQEAIAALSERAAAQVRSLVTGEDWEAWLRLAARLPGWSFTNIMLTAAQRPAATVLAGYQQWQAQGRQVRKGEPGIQLIAVPAPPARRTGRSNRSARAHVPDQAVISARAARLSYVWDIAQTSGTVSAGSPKPAPAAGGTPPGVWDVLTWLARREGFAVDRGDTGPDPGAANWRSRRIRIRPGLSQAEAATALAHELGHVLAHDNLALVPGTSSAGCRGILKLEADSIAFIVAAPLGLDTAGCSWPHVASWAGADPRARPQETIAASGARINTAAATITAYLDSAVSAARPPQVTAGPIHSPHRPERAAGTDLLGEPTGTADCPATAASLHTEVADAAAVDPPRAGIGRILLDAERFYLDHLAGSWVPAYLESRGLSQATWTQWRVGYAPGGWTALVDHLRGLGHADHVIVAAGLARRSSGGTLIDHFRDRLMLAIRDEPGMVAGFIGRVHPKAEPSVPKYMNSPETSAFTKGDLLFGLHEARPQLARGAVPVVVEGPFDAIAVSTVSPGRYAGVAPCGTALTSRQAAALARAADLSRTGILVALDGDRAGREAAVRAHDVLLAVTGKAAAVMLPPGRDPADVLTADGLAALDSFLQHHVEPLATVVIDAHLDSWASRLDHPEGRLWAMRSAATHIANMLPPDAAGRILQTTGGGTIATLDETLRPVANPKLPVIARTLPVSATCQIAQVADRLRCDYSDVIAEVANAASMAAAVPKRPAARGQRSDPAASTSGGAESSTTRLVTASFPDSPRAVTTAASQAGPKPWPRPAGQRMSAASGP